MGFNPWDGYVDFFETNRTILYFVYGLAFFVLGLAIILRTRFTPRNELARGLRWLAAFGIFHAFHEWGEVFILLQSTYMSEFTISLLRLVRLFLLALSFYCMLTFGFSLLPIGSKQWARALPKFLLLVWMAVTIALVIASTGNESSWANPSNALARYSMGFPGGLLAAYSLRRYARLRIEPLNAPKIVFNLRAAGVALGVYAVLAGLIPPRVSFFPGNTLNYETVTDVIHVPPLILRSIAGLVMAVTLIRALDIFELVVQRRIEQLEQRHILAAERERLARELHDGAIQKVYTAGLLVQSAARLADSGSEIGARLARSVTTLGDAITDLRRNLTELGGGSTKGSDSLPALLRQMTANPAFSSVVDVALEMDAFVDRGLPPVRFGHVQAILSEALANVVRHAKAQHVTIRASDLGAHMRIEIADDGIGMSSVEEAGYGLRNMRDRSRLLNGSLEISSGSGTTVTLTIPWKDEKALLA